MELNGLLRACKYSFEPNRLGYCGPNNSFAVFKDFIKEPTEEKAKEIVNLLSDFNAFFPYVNLIAEKNKKYVFEEEVVEAYWIGNNLLYKVFKEDIEDLILNKLAALSSLPKEIFEKKVNYLPEKPLINHSFHVLYINFITRKLDPLLKNLDSCLVKPAKVLEIRENSYFVKSYSIYCENKEIGLKEKRFRVQKGFVDADEKDLISIHWGLAIEKINDKQKKFLIDTTKSNLRYLQIK
ncbi:MAG: DUF6390 family protein [Candidatus Diapherotrites archaeon]|nr:DUF6390 family protein [Candidatus Diapherotrites archaeon]